MELAFASAILSSQLFMRVSAIQYTTQQRGQKFTNDFSLYFRKENGDLVSPWHDIPLYNTEDRSNQTLNMVVEIPRFTQAKFEINREEGLNPIKQDLESGKPRFLPNIFPMHGHPCNYGALPQTWENPYHTDSWTGLHGDKDPLDVCEVGSKPRETGSVISVRVLGILAMLDSGETDWKVIAMDAEEAQERSISDMESLEREEPGMAKAVQDFFRLYKVPSGKGENKFGFAGEVQDKHFAQEVVDFLHLEWLDMMSNCTAIASSQDGQFGTFNTQNTQVVESSCQIGQEKAESEVNEQPPAKAGDADIPEKYQAWYFLEENAALPTHPSLPLVALLIVLRML